MMQNGVHIILMRREGFRGFTFVSGSNRRSAAQSNLLLGMRDAASIFPTVVYRSRRTSFATFPKVTCVAGFVKFSANSYMRGLRVWWDLRRHFKVCPF